MGDDAVNMSLDDIIKQNKQQHRTSRSRGRGGGIMRGRGGGRGRGRGRGGGRGGSGGAGGGRGGGGVRGRSQSRPGTPGPGQRRSQSRGPRNGRSQSRGPSQSRSRSQSQVRSRSRQRRANSKARSSSRSRSRLRGLTPRGRAGLEEQLDMPPLVNRRGGFQNRLWRSNSNPNLQNSIHSRLGLTPRRGAANLRTSPGAKRGISKRGRGYTTGNRYSTVGLRSDQILQQQLEQTLNNMIRSQTFRRSRNNSFSSPSSQLTVSVANDYTKRRRNSVGNASYSSLNRQTLAQLNNQFGGYNSRRGPGSVISVGSNRSNRSNRSNHSNRSNRSYRSNYSNTSNRSRGRGGFRGVGRKFNNRQILNPKLQKEIAALQGKSYNTNVQIESPGGVNFAPTPCATKLTLHQRFASK